MHALLQTAFSLLPLCVRADFGPPLKRFSVSRCPRDDLDRIRLPDDVSKEIRAECCRTHLPSRRHSRPSCHHLRRSDEHSER